jgi:thiol:disulfide interchange protein DsbD
VLVWIGRTRDALLGGVALFALASGLSVPLLVFGTSAGRLLPRAGAWMGTVKKLFGVVLLATGCWIVAPLLPAFRAPSPDAPHFAPVASTAALDAALAGGQPVLLDFHADWCVACREMEEKTFSVPAVRAQLAGVRLLRADVTAAGPFERALLKRFGLFGPPAVLLFDGRGHEIPDARVIGFQDAPTFLRTLAATRTTP